MEPLRPNDPILCHGGGSSGEEVRYDGQRIRRRCKTVGGHDAVEGVFDVYELVTIAGALAYEFRGHEGLP